jgi:hypothetical protein
MKMETGTDLSELQAEHLAKILFTKAHALCHDVNLTTKSANHLDVVIGFSTADILWYEPFAQKYNRINKNVSLLTIEKKKKGASDTFRV